MNNGSFIYIFGNNAGEKFSSIISKLSDTHTKISEIIGKESNLPGYSPYFLFPYIFNNSFEYLDEMVLDDLCLVSELCLEFCLYSDRLADGQAVLDEKYYYETCVHEKYIQILMNLAGDKEKFWELYYKYYKEYVYAVTTERKNHFGIINDFPYEEFEMISIGKQALTKLIPAVLGAINDRWNDITLYEKVVDKLAVAMQLHDDLVDWKDDLNSKRFSWLLNRIIMENNLDISCSADEVRNIIFNKDYDIELLSKANCFCENAMLEGNVSDEWIRYTRFFQARINTLLVDLLELRGQDIDSCCYYYRNNKGKSIYKKSDLTDVINNAGDFIIKQQEYDYHEMKSWFLDIERDGESVYLIGGDIFQRAVLLNLMLENASVFKDKSLFSIFAEKEINHILECKTKIYECGWVYIEGLIDNCPDLDTFSEILRISRLYSHNEELSKEVEKVLHKVFEINKTNQFSTWIIKEDEPDYERISKRFGFVSEVDVNANFICALNCLDSKKYQNIIKENASYIYTFQNEDGYWDSSWYIGKFYTGYVLSKTFSLVKNNEVIDKYRTFLINSQNDNGSWGSSVGNPLETAFVILTLNNIGNFDIEQKLMIKRAAKYLLDTVTPNGYWYGCEFIKYGIGKQKVNKQYARYRSSVLTTGFCMAALSKIEESWEIYESVEI